MSARRGRRPARRPGRRPGPRSGRQSRGVAKRRTRSVGKPSKEPVAISLATIDRLMKSILGFQTRKADGKTDGIRLTRTGAFGMSYLLENITQELIKQGARLSEAGEDGSTILPKHLPQTVNEVFTSLHRIINVQQLNDQVASLNSQLNIVPGRASGGRSRSRARAAPATRPTEGNRSRGLSRAVRSQSRSPTGRSLAGRSPARRDRKSPASRGLPRRSAARNGSHRSSIEKHEAEANQPRRVRPMRRNAMARSSRPRSIPKRRIRATRTMPLPETVLAKSLAKQVMTGERPNRGPASRGQVKGDFGLEDPDKEIQYEFDIRQSSRGPSLQEREISFRRNIEKSILAKQRSIPVRSPVDRSSAVEGLIEGRRASGRSPFRRDMPRYGRRIPPVNRSRSRARTSPARSLARSPARSLARERPDEERPTDEYPAEVGPTEDNVITRSAANKRFLARRAELRQSPMTGRPLEDGLGSPV